MSRTVVGLFESSTAAETAVGDLLHAGVERDQISFITPQPAERHEGIPPVSITEKSDATAGALVGGIGGLVLGLAALAIPGVGPVIAAGPLAASLAGAGVGAASGALIGALTGAGVSDRE